MDKDYREDDKLLEDADKIRIISNHLCKIVANNDLEEIEESIKLIKMNINNLNIALNKEKIIYTFVKYLNRCLVNKPGVRDSACYEYDETLKETLDGIIHDKEALKEMKKYLNNSRKSKDYKELPLVFNLLVILIFISNNRSDKVIENTEIFKYGINGISYMPAELVEDRTKELRATVDKGIKILKRK